VVGAGRGCLLAQIACEPGGEGMRLRIDAGRVAVGWPWNASLISPWSLQVDEGRCCVAIGAGAVETTATAAALSLEDLG